PPLPKAVRANSGPPTQNWLHRPPRSDRARPVAEIAKPGQELPVRRRSGICSEFRWLPGRLPAQTIQLFAPSQASLRASDRLGRGPLRWLEAPRVEIALCRPADTPLRTASSATASYSVSPLVLMMLD